MRASQTLGHERNCTNVVPNLISLLSRQSHIAEQRPNCVEGNMRRRTRRKTKQVIFLHASRPSLPSSLATCERGDEGDVLSVGAIYGETAECTYVAVTVHAWDTAGRKDLERNKNGKGRFLRASQSSVHRSYVRGTEGGGSHVHLHRQQLGTTMYSCINSLTGSYLPVMHILTLRKQVVYINSDHRRIS
jgi:hypothetical protein